MTLTLHDIADTGDHGQPETQALSIQKQEKAQTRRQMFIKAMTSPEAGHLQKLLDLAEGTQYYILSCQ